MSCWDRLPDELWLKIWSRVAGPDDKLTHEDFRQPNMANYAVVNSKWNAYFEERTFASLSVFNHQMENFHQVIKNRPERLKRVRRLQYTIDLPQYHNNDKHRDEDQETIRINNIVFSHSMMLLVRTLSLWQPPCSEIDNTTRECYMQLELGVRSYSDATSYFKDMRIFDPHGPIMSVTDNCELCCWIGKDAIGWEGFRRTQLPSPSAVRRVFGGRLLTLADHGRPDILALTNPTSETKAHAHAQAHDESLKLQAAPIVRKLAASRNFYRGIHPKVYTHMIQHFFPRVESIKLEPWRPLDEFNYKALEDGFVEMLDTLPPKMHTLSVYLEQHDVTHPGVYPVRAFPYVQGHVEYLHPELDLPSVHYAINHRLPRAHIAQRLAKYMHTSKIENVCIAGFAEAADLFREVLESGTCPKLKTLLVSSAVTLAENKTNDGFWDLLVQAARAAEQMPCLEWLEIVSTDLWNPWRFNVKIGLAKGQRVGGYLCTSLCLDSGSWPSKSMPTNVRIAWADSTRLRGGRVIGVSHISRACDILTRLILCDESLSHSFLLPRSIANIKLDRWAMRTRLHATPPNVQYNTTSGNKPRGKKDLSQCMEDWHNRKTNSQHRSDKARWHNCSGCGKDKCVAAMGAPCRFGKDNSVKALIYELNPQQKVDDRLASTHRRRLWQSSFATSVGMTRQLGHWDTYDNADAFNTNLSYDDFFEAWHRDPYRV